MKEFYCNGKKGVCDMEYLCADCKFKNDTGGQYIEVEDIKVEEPAKNPYWERICALADRQRAKGIRTYGQGLEANTAAIMARIQHLEEELIDGLMYCEWIKDKFMEGENHD